MTVSSYQGLIHQRRDDAMMKEKLAMMKEKLAMKKS